VKTKQIRHSQSFGCFCFSLTLLSFELYNKKGIRETAAAAAATGNAQ